MKKRVISLLLAVMLLAGVMSVSAFAADDVVIELNSYEDSEEFYPGTDFSVPVKIIPEGYAGVQIDIETSDNVAFDGYDWEGYIEYSETGFLWLNGVEDEDGGIDVTNGLVNVKNADLDEGIIGELHFSVADDAKAGDKFEIKITVSAASAEEQWIVKDAVASTSGTISKRPYTLGDVYIDGRINSRDAALVASYAVGNATLDETQKLAADVTGDGRINSRDASMIASYAVGNITEF